MPPIWALFLAISGVGVLLVIARVVLADRGGSALQAGLAGSVPLVTGLLLGFATLTVPPIPITWIWAVVVAGLLILHYSAHGRLAHIGLLAIGFGLTWTGIIGWRVWTDLTDPAVTGTGDAFVFLAIGMAALSGGIVTVAAALALAPRRTAPPGGQSPPP